MVGRFIEDQHIRLGEEHARQGYTLGLAAGEMFDRHIGVGDVKLREHLASHIGAIPILIVDGIGRGSGIFDSRHPCRHHGRLLQIADTEPIAIYHSPRIIILMTRENIQKCRLAIAIASHKPYLITLIHTQSHIGKHQPIAERLCQLLYLQKTNHLHQKLLDHKITKFFHHSIFRMNLKKASRPDVSGGLPEPRVGLEPTTFSLRMKCSTD